MPVICLALSLSATKGTTADRQRVRHRGLLNIAERPPEPARLILDPLDRKLVHNSRDMDRLSRHAGSISLSSNRLCIHDQHAGQAPKTRAMNHSGIGYTGTQCRHGNLGAPQFLG